METMQHRPHCDDLESKRNNLTVISKRDGAIEYAREFLCWTTKITRFVSEPDGTASHLPEGKRRSAEKLGIKIDVDDHVVRMVGPRRGTLSEIVTKSGKRFKIEGLFYHLDCEIQNQLGKELDCAIDRGFVKVDGMQKASVENVYAAGGLGTDRHFIASAPRSGTLRSQSMRKCFCWPQRNGTDGAQHSKYRETKERIAI